MNNKKINIDNYKIYRKRFLKYIDNKYSLNNTINSIDNSNFIDLFKQNIKIKNKYKKNFSRNLINKHLLTTSNYNTSSFNKRKEYNDNIYKKFI